MVDQVKLTLQLLAPDEMVQEEAEEVRVPDIVREAVVKETSEEYAVPVEFVA